MMGNYMEKFGMGQIVENNYWVFLIASVLLFVLSVTLRVKSAKTTKDKWIYTIYGVATGLFTVALIIFKVMGQ